MKRLFLLLPFLLAGCPPTNKCYYNAYANVTNYETSPDTLTPQGLTIRTNGNSIDLEEIDRLTNEIEACIETSIRRECITIVVPPDWYISECTDQKLFPCYIDEEICRVKMRAEGMEEEEIDARLDRCPCNCRAAIQDENVIITAPNLLLYPAELIRMVTGINNPWESEYIRCLTSTTPEEENEEANPMLSLGPSSMLW